MVPPQFVNFFLASAGAGAALVGLLFVAVSIAPEQIVMANAPVDRQAMASSSFTALLNAFFISLGALIPTNLGGITLVLSLTGLTHSIYLAWSLLKARQRWQNMLRRLFMIVVSLIIYGYELYCAILLLNEPRNLGGFFVLTWLLLAVYGIGLTRAWQLLGARRFGIMSWLSPLHELNQAKPTATQEEIRASSKTVSDELR
jgi:hypothetical protein